MKALNIKEFTELKEISEKEYGVRLHMHDACGAQYISLEENCDDEYVNFLNGYLEDKRLNAVVADDRRSFTIKG